MKIKLLNIFTGEKQYKKVSQNEMKELLEKEKSQTRVLRETPDGSLQS